MKVTCGVIFLVACLLFLGIFVFPIEKCNSKNVLLEQDDFPVKTIVEEIHSPIGDMPERSASISAYYRGSSMYQLIARYPSSALAEKEFDRFKKKSSGKTEIEGPWETPPELSYTSSFFKNYYVACAPKWDGEYQCRMVGQYKQYFVFFFAYITDHGITLNHVNSILQKIDMRAEQCLGQ